VLLPRVPENVLFRHDPSLVSHHPCAASSGAGKRPLSPQSFAGLSFHYFRRSAQQTCERVLGKRLQISRRCPPISRTSSGRCLTGDSAAAARR
jgi:hypothetical protein